MTRSTSALSLSAICLGLALLLTACSSLDQGIADDKIDYRDVKVRQTPLDVPPDLTQLSTDGRYQAQGGSISAAEFQSATANTQVAAPAGSQVVAPQSLGNFRLESQGNLRWLSTTLTPEQLWPQLQAFWTERGMALVADQPELGIMETEWAENRAKLPKDVIRRTLGRLVESLYSTGERDKFRLRVERSPNGSEIYLSHRGMEEVYTDVIKTSTSWQPRASDPLLEREMLSRLMVRLGAKDEQAKTALVNALTGATAAATLPRARVLTDRPAATLLVDDSFDRAWRRVGLALDRSGFTVEDRDRTQGVYFVRYVDPAQAGKEEPGFFSRLFSTEEARKFTGPVRYRVSVKAEGQASTVTVLNAAGTPENGDAGKRIVALLAEDLK